MIAGMIAFMAWSASGALSLRREATSRARSISRSAGRTSRTSPPVFRFLRAHVPSGEEEVHGDIVGNAPRQALDRTRAGEEPALHLGQPELRMVRREQDVGGQRQLETAADRPPR